MTNSSSYVDHKRWTNQNYLEGLDPLLLCDPIRQLLRDGVSPSLGIVLLVQLLLHVLQGRPLPAVTALVTAVRNARELPFLPVPLPLRYIDGNGG